MKKISLAAAVFAASLVSTAAMAGIHNLPIAHDNITVFSNNSKWINLDREIDVFYDFTYTCSYVLTDGAITLPLPAVPMNWYKVPGATKTVYDEVYDVDGNIDGPAYVGKELFSGRTAKSGSGECEGEQHFRAHYRYFKKF